MALLQNNTLNFRWTYVISKYTKYNLNINSDTNFLIEDSLSPTEIFSKLLKVYWGHCSFIFNTTKIVQDLNLKDDPFSEHPESSFIEEHTCSESIQYVFELSMNKKDMEYWPPYVFHKSVLFWDNKTWVKF